MTKHTRIHLIRHGQVAGHDTPRYNGQHDVALTDYGVTQYHLLKERLAEVPLSACYSSDLSRCTIGANIICGERGITPQLHPELRELNIGIWEGLSWGEIIERWPEEWHARLADMVNYRIPQGENLLDLQTRVMPVVNRIVENHQGEEVLLVAHGGVNRIILLTAMDAPLSSVFNIEQNYACHNIIDYYSDGKVTVKLLNRQVP